MLKSLRRVVVLRNHLQGPGLSNFIQQNCKTISSTATASAPTLTVTPDTGLVDDKVNIHLTGLNDGQIVTLAASLQEGGGKFESRGVYKANKDGQVDTKSDPSISGTYTNVNPMGLFWSQKPTPGQKPGMRLVKKDVGTSLNYTISVYDGAVSDDTDIASQPPLASAAVHRSYKTPGVRRIPVTEGQYRGTIFVPEGEGPFPGLIDTFGGLVSLIETRAALLASRGYATFALSYLYQGHLPKNLMAADPHYITESVNWFSQQEYVDEDRLGAIGLCYGGCLSLICAALSPKLKAVVNINGLTVAPSVLEETVPWSGIPVKDKKHHIWPDPTKVYKTDEGIVIRDVFDCDTLTFIPAWQHGAKLLLIVGEDDHQVPPRYMKDFMDAVPEPYRSNVELVSYPGAGHLIEPPYSPLCRVVNPGKTRMATIDFVKEQFHGELMMAGGYPEPHAFAQEDAWERILAFLQKNLYSIK